MTTSHPRLPDETLVQLAGRIAHLGGGIADLPDGRVFWSDEVCAIFEVARASTPTLEEAFGFFPPEWRPRVRQMFETCVGTGAGYDEELEIISAAGRRKWVRATAEAVYGADGAVVRIQGAFQDISAAKHADHHGRILASRLTNTLESITDAVVMLDREWRFTFINSTAERLLRAPREEVIGMVIWERFPEAVGGRYYNEYHRP